MARSTWIIERVAPASFLPLYLRRDCEVGESMYWTRDPHQARRFESKAAAEGFAGELVDLSGVTLQVIEHVWDGVS